MQSLAAKAQEGLHHRGVCQSAGVTKRILLSDQAHESQIRTLRHSPHRIPSHSLVNGWAMRADAGCENPTLFGK